MLHRTRYVCTGIHPWVCQALVAASDSRHNCCTHPFCHGTKAKLIEFSFAHAVLLFCVHTTAFIDSLLCVYLKPHAQWLDTEHVHTYYQWRIVCNASKVAAFESLSQPVNCLDVCLALSTML